MRVAVTITDSGTNKSRTQVARLDTPPRRSCITPQSQPEYKVSGTAGTHPLQMITVSRKDADSHSKLTDRSENSTLVRYSTYYM
jgi:hypothetical protein